MPDASFPDDAGEQKDDGADVDRLLRQVMDTVHGAIDGQARWELLLDAVVAMAADLSLDGLLERIVVVARQLAGARYAALGVLDLGGERRLRTFIHHGMDSESVVEIGDLPSGHGLLGLIIDRPEPLRLHDITEHPESYGFPAGHPPMHSFLGVPVRTRDKVFGNLYLTERQGGGDFTAQDERIVVALAAAAGVAIENAQLYEDAHRRERWLSATAEITGTLLGPVQGRHALQVVADRARDVAEADVVWVVSGPVEAGRDEELALQVVSGLEVAVDLVADVPTENSVAREVITSSVPLVIEDLATDGRVTALSGLPECRQLGPAIFVPLSATSGFTGVLGLAWTPEHGSRRLGLDIALLASFAEQAALSLQVTRSHADRERLALFEDRDRIGRDLHDLVIQRLFAVGLSLQGAGRQADSPELRRRLDLAVDDLDGTIKDIRGTIFELGATGLASDMRAEITQVVRRAESTLKFRPTLRFVGPVGSVLGADAAADLLAVLTEALSNAARHARASEVDVSVTAGEEIVLEVIDNGSGIPREASESGLHNMRQRAERRGGRCQVGPGQGGGTRVRWSIPVRGSGHGP